MIVKDKRPQHCQDEPAELLLPSTPGDPGLCPPPPFEVDLPRLPGDFTVNIDGPPPDFALYEADFFETGSGDIVSHDPHLNSDGEALYRFLLAQADKLPSCVLHCRGTHSEYRTRWVTGRLGDGHTESRTETYSETVTDFDFYIDATPQSAAKPIHWSVADTEPAYRGLMVREVEGSHGKRVARKPETKASERWSKERRAAGLPPWTTVTNGRREEALKSSKHLRQWADEYCLSPKYLKEFVYDKVVYGWNLQQLETAVRALILTTRYHGRLEVDFEIRGSKVFIRPDNKLSRMLSNKWLKFLSIIFLVFPFIWFFKRFHPRGGGRWEVCGGAYALKRWVPITEEGQLYDSSLVPGPPKPSSSMTQTENGRARLEGLREGEWLRRWEGTITRAVLGRYQSSTPLSDNGRSMDANLSYLDGY